MEKWLKVWKVWYGMVWYGAGSSSSPLLSGLLLLLQQLCGIESVVLKHRLTIAVGQSGVHFMGSIGIRRRRRWRWRRCVCFGGRRGVWLAVFSIVVVLLMVYRIHLEAVGSIDRAHFEWNCVRHVCSVGLCAGFRLKKKLFGFLWAANANNGQTVCTALGPLVHLATLLCKSGVLIPFLFPWESLKTKHSHLALYLLIYLRFSALHVYL